MLHGQPNVPPFSLLHNKCLKESKKNATLPKWFVLNDECRWTWTHLMEIVWYKNYVHIFLHFWEIVRYMYFSVLPLVSCITRNTKNNVV